MATSKDRQINGRIGALESWGRTKDRAARTKKARAASPGQVEYWLPKVDPEGRMSPVDRIKAAEAKRRAHMLRLAKASAEARSRKTA